MVLVSEMFLTRYFTELLPHDDVCWLGGVFRLLRIVG